MPSPFPGMDPYLEGYLWSDVHQSLAGQFKRQLSPLLRPRYVVRLAVYFVGDNVPAHEVGILYPDVEVVWTHAKDQSATGGPVTAPPVPGAITPPALTLPASLPLEVRLTSVHVLDVAGNELVTSIEIISPTNKREPGLSAYREKRAELIRAGVHLLDLDLIRRGNRPWAPDGLPVSPYLALLTRARHASTEAWPIQLRDPLPVLPVPLRPPDPDVPLDLPLALATIYDESDYLPTLDYRNSPPEPALSEPDEAWVHEILVKAGAREGR